MSASRRSRNALQVLVVDDDTDARLLARVMIEACCDARVTLAASVEEAMAILRMVLPDLVVTDANMPGEDGLALLSRLRALPGGERVPVIVATAALERDLHEQLRSAGARAVLPKPLTPEALAEAILALADTGGR